MFLLSTVKCGSERFLANVAIAPSAVLPSVVWCTILKGPPVWLPDEPVMGRHVANGHLGTSLSPFRERSSIILRVDPDPAESSPPAVRGNFDRTSAVP